jgi:hypothetical protein
MMFVLVLRITLGNLQKNFEWDFRKTTLHSFMRSLDDIHAVNAYKSEHIHLSASKIKLENSWADLD